MGFDFALIQANAPGIVSAIGVTFLLWIVCSLIGMAAGFLVAIGLHWGPRPLRWLLRGYVELIRGTPFLVQVFLLYYGGPFVGIMLDNIPTGIIGLSIYAAAYYAELFRSGFSAVPRGHIEAGACVGLSPRQILGSIILPEMTMLLLPSLVNMTILLLKETATLSIISVPELTLEVSAIGTASYAFVESFTVLALLYWGLVECCSWAGRKAEQRLSRYRFTNA